MSRKNPQTWRWVKWDYPIWDRKCNKEKWMEPKTCGTPGSIWTCAYWESQKERREKRRKEFSKKLSETSQIKWKMLTWLAYLANPNQQHTERIIHHNRTGFITEMQGCFILWKSIHTIDHINRIKKKKDHFTRWRKNIWQNPARIHDKNKTLNELG